MAALTITATQVLEGAGALTMVKNAGEAITAGQVVYLDSSTNTWKLAQCDGTAAEATARGIALNGAALGQPVKAQTAGYITLGAGAAPVVGTVYFVSPTAGGISPVADLGSTNYVSVLGVGGSTNILRMSIHNSGSAVP